MSIYHIFCLFYCTPYSKNNVKFVDNDYPHIDSVKTLHSGTYLCVCADDPHNEKEYTDKLYEKINQMGYEVAGDYLCEVISQFPISKNKKGKLIYKAQVPVEKR